MALLVPGAPELVASAASAKMTVPSDFAAIWIPSSTLCNTHCMWDRIFQKLCPMCSASFSAKDRFLSVIKMTRDPCSGQSVGGWPNMIPPARTSSRSSRRLIYRITVPCTPVAVLSSSPRTMVGI